jgi:hypothetical protein
LNNDQKIVCAAMSGSSARFLNGPHSKAIGQILAL